MQITQLLEGETLLTYALSTSPAPLQVSPSSGPPAVASLMIVISAPVGPGDVTVTQVVFKLPVGNPEAPDSGDLTEDATSIAPSVSSSGTDGWTCERGVAPGVFLLKPQTGSPGVITRQGIAVTLNKLHVSPTVGTAKLKISELAAAADHPGERRECVLAVPKFPAGFHAGNFAAERPSVANGEPAVLTWSGSAEAVYTILWATHSRIVSDLRRWVSPALIEATTFILQVAAQEAGETVVLYFSATVMVLNPSLVAKELTVTTGPLTTPNLIVQGPANAALLHVSGATVLNGANISALAVHGALGVGGMLTAAGGMDIFRSVQDITPTGGLGDIYQADVDGFLLCSIEAMHFDPLTVRWAMVSAEIHGKTGWWTARAAGVGNSFLCPVPKGMACRLEQYDPPDRAGNPPAFRFKWLPLGHPPNGGPTFRKIN